MKLLLSLLLLCNCNELSSKRTLCCLFLFFSHCLHDLYFCFCGFFILLQDRFKMVFITDLGGHLFSDCIRFYLVFAWIIPFFLCCTLVCHHFISFSFFYPFLLIRVQKKALVWKCIFRWRFNLISSATLYIWTRNGLVNRLHLPSAKMQFNFLLFFEPRLFFSNTDWITYQNSIDPMIGFKNFPFKLL